MSKNQRRSWDDGSRTGIIYFEDWRRSHKQRNTASGKGSETDSPLEP